MPLFVRFDLDANTLASTWTFFCFLCDHDWHQPPNGWWLAPPVLGGVAAAGGMVDSPSKREKLKAMKKLKKRGAYPKHVEGSGGTRIRKVCDSVLTEQGSKC